MVARRLTWLVALAVVLPGCSTVRSALGVPSAGDPSVTIKPAATRWVLIKNPRFGDVASEPEYIWVEEDRIPTTVRTLLLGKRSIIAAPEVVARYGPPPGGGRISPRQGMPTHVADAEP